NADLVLGWGLFTRATVLTLWTILALFAALYLARLAVGQRKVGGGSRARGLVAAAAALLLAAWLASGISGRQLPQVEAFLPPSAPIALASPAGITPTWILNDYTGALDAARASGKLVFIDFTGYTCTNCRWMEANIFSRPDVGAELGQFVLARLYTDGDGDIYQRQQSFQERTFGTVALPLYAVVDGAGSIRATFSGLTREPAEFIAFLRNARAARVATTQ
ncbi:MAG TPA: thioredoxin family protein, partial [Gemmatimonadaceae bacterium]|nr:thioredoxin family protein [Gemmatimonadaceae bacterium]